MNINKILRLIFIILCLVFSSFAQAKSGPTPLGLWKTYDLKHTARSIIKISLRNGELVGTIVESLTHDVCTSCSGPWQNKSVVGMPIIWGLKKMGNTWENGRVLNVDNGKTYNCYVSVSDDNKILYFSPFVGMHWMGKTIKWERVG